DYITDDNTDMLISSEPLNNPNPTLNEPLAIALDQAIDKNQIVVQNIISTTNTAISNITKIDATMDGVNEQWLHSSYKNFLNYALPKLPFMCQEPFKYFWHNLIKYKHKFVELDKLKEEIEEQNIKKARRLKTPTFQFPKDATKLDLTEFEKQQTLLLNLQYYNNLFEHTTNLYNKHIDELKNYLNGIEIQKNEISMSNDFPYEVSNYANAFATGADTFKDLYAEGRQPTGHFLAAALNHEAIHLAAIPQPVEDP
ncbi:1494_t:CDS:2, partial [Cetraspora pellucida]